MTRRLVSLCSPVPAFCLILPSPYAIGCEDQVRNMTRNPRNDKFLLNCIYLVVPPELGKSIWVNDAEDLGFLVFPLDVGHIAAVREELVYVIPQ